MVFNRIMAWRRVEFYFVGIILLHTACNRKIVSAQTFKPSALRLAAYLRIVLDCNWMGNFCL